MADGSGRVHRLLAIDAGFAAMGIVVAEGPHVLYAETVRTERTAKRRRIRVADDDAERCMQLARRLLWVIRALGVAGAVVELPHGGAQGARAARAMGMATGAVAAVLESMSLPAEWMLPGEVKAAVAGRRDATKQDVAAAVKAKLDWSQVEVPQAQAEAEHIYDAAAALIAARDGPLARALDAARGSARYENGRSDGGGARV